MVFSTGWNSFSFFSFPRCFPPPAFHFFSWSIALWLSSFCCWSLSVGFPLPFPPPPRKIAYQECCDPARHGVFCLIAVRSFALVFLFFRFFSLGLISFSFPMKRRGAPDLPPLTSFLPSFHPGRFNTVFSFLLFDVRLVTFSLGDFFILSILSPRITTHISFLCRLTYFFWSLFPPPASHTPVIRMFKVGVLSFRRAFFVATPNASSLFRHIPRKSAHHLLKYLVLGNRSVLPLPFPVSSGRRRPWMQYMKRV